jgi:hypothetical protein
VIGVDVTYHDNKIYLLEFNDGPVLSEIVELAQQYHQSGCIAAVTECGSFIKAIADLCMNKLEKKKGSDATFKLCVSQSRI